MIKTLLLVGTGGFLGSVSRFLASRLIQSNLYIAINFGRSQRKFRLSLRSLMNLTK